MTLTKTKTMFLFGALSVALILPFSLVEMEGNSIPFAEAAPQNANERNTPNEKVRNEEPPAWGLASEVLDFEFVDLNPPQINENTLNDLKIAVTKNHQVKELLGDDFEYITDGQLGNDDGWEHVLIYATDNGENRVTVTMDKDKVVDVLKEKPINWGVGLYQDRSKDLTEGDVTNSNINGTDLTETVPTEPITWNNSRAFAIDQYDDDRYGVRGVLIFVDVPDYTYNTGDFTALLLNAQKAGSIDEDTCDPSKVPTSYWGQVGIGFDDNGAKLGYTDTTLGCAPAWFPHIQYSTGDTIIFAIFINDATDEWFLYADNTDDSSLPVAWVKVVPGSSLLDIDTRGTSVFFENSNHESDGDWSSGFASDPVVDAAFWRYTNDNWYVWFDEDQYPVDCEPGTTASQLMSGTFVGYPYDVTFDVSEIQERCHAPS